MADPKKTGPTAPGAKPPEEELKTEVSRVSGSMSAAGEVEQLKKENTEHRERARRLNFAIRQLAAAIVTPSAQGDKGAGRRNLIGQAIQSIVKEFAFEEDE